MSIVPGTEETTHVELALPCVLLEIQNENVFNIYSISFSHDIFII